MIMVGGGSLSDPELKKSVERIEEKIESQGKKNAIFWVVSIIVAIVLAWIFG